MIKSQRGLRPQPDEPTPTDTRPLHRLIVSDSPMASTPRQNLNNPEKFCRMRA
jgi:hypothetical protein